MPVIGVNYWQKLEEDLSLSSLSFAWLLGIWIADAALSRYLHLGNVKVKSLEYYRFYKTKYLVDSFYIFLCHLAELVTLFSSMSLPGDTQQGQH